MRDNLRQLREILSFLLWCITFDFTTFIVVVLALYFLIGFLVAIA